MNHVDPEGARLFEKREQRFLGGGLRDRRDVAEDLIHVDERAEARRPGARSHPSENLIEEKRHEEHPLGVGEVRDVKDRHAGFSFARIKNAVDIEGIAREPRFEARRGEKIVESGGELETVLRRVERLDLENPDAGHGRRLHGVDERGEVEVSPVLPRVLENRGDEDVLPALDWVPSDPEKREKARRRGRDPFGKKIPVLEDLLGRRAESAENRYRKSRLAPRRVDREVRRVLEPLDSLSRLIPFGEPLSPERGLRLRVRVGRGALALRRFLVDPRPEVRR
jgi:hypothetical protein